METIKIVVPVTFTGNIEVEVPATIPQERRNGLARKVALARVLATTENPDAPEDDACDEYETEFGLDEATAGRDWDDSKTAGVGGKWSLQDDITAIVTRLVGKAQSARLQPEDLDESVHDLASSVASDANNDGLEGQVRYLVSGIGAKGADEQIDKLIAEKE